MKFLAIDTSAKTLLVAARNEDADFSYCAESAERHSVDLFPAIEDVLRRAGLTLPVCDFLACAVGPGSFTGIRIGIAAVKGLSMGAGRPALAVTSLDAIAYAEESDTKVAAIDAGHGYVYAQGYGAAAFPAGYYPVEEVAARAERASAPILAAEEIAGLDTAVIDRTKGLLTAASVKCYLGTSEPSDLAAVYLRKSNAEERR